MIERKNKCPKCHSSLLAREGRFIFCLNSVCSWAVQSQRASDKDIEEINQTKQEWA